MNVLSVYFLKVIFEALPRPRDFSSRPGSSHAPVWGGEAGAQGKPYFESVRGITTSAQATSIHLIVTAGVQACQYSRVMFVSENLQGNIA